jgi:hypothetical protein
MSLPSERLEDRRSLLHAGNMLFSLDQMSLRPSDIRVEPLRGVELASSGSGPSICDPSDIRFERSEDTGKLVCRSSC